MSIAPGSSCAPPRARTVSPSAVALSIAGPDMALASLAPSHCPATGRQYFMTLDT